MRLTVTFEDGEPLKIETGERGPIKFRVMRGIAVFERASDLCTDSELEKAAGEAQEQLEFIEKAVL